MNKVTIAHYFRVSMIFVTILTGVWALVPAGAIAQNLTGFVDTFDNGSLDTLWSGSRVPLWVADFTHTFSLEESGGVLNIQYTRDAQSDQWDQFYFQPPDSIDVSQNPTITVDVKSNVTTLIALKPIYSNGKSDDALPLRHNIPNDDQWHSYSFTMNKSLYSGAFLTRIYVYLDPGTTAPKSGMLQFDNFKIAGFSIKITDLKATLVDSSHVDLNWSADKPAAANSFRIYRGTVSGFSANASTLVGDTTAEMYHDRGLMNNTTYYYKVAAVDTNGIESTPSGEVSVRTYVPGLPPAVEITGTNSNEIDEYQKFEVTLNLENAAYQNPYDPDQIDVHAWFKSPKGDTTRVNGFYDDYQNVHSWKIRFAPDETGTWKYQIMATDAGGTGESSVQTFTADSSGRHGWLTISDRNTNYLAYTDSTAFYGLAAYYPWSVTESGLDELKQHGVNIIGYWNGTYDNAGNGGGNRLIESMQSGLGHYDQLKCGRIDQILGWLQERHMKMMFALWPHDYLNIGTGATGGWPHQYDAANPYSTIVDAADFYGDSLAWVYQQKLYRYIIARWGYSTSLGIWEIVNEIHGTTGWTAHQDQAKAWVNKVNAYLKEHDPHKRPTTASYGSSSIWQSSSIKPDIANRHYYEAQGYPQPYGSTQPIRNGLHDAVNEMRTLKKAGDRPAIFGEAGATALFSPVNSSGYTSEMHDIFWAGLTNGMASTPFWWDFTTHTVFTSARLDLYDKFKPFADSLALAESPDTAMTVTAKGSYGYGMKNAQGAFGWLYSYPPTKDISGTSVQISGLDNGTYALAWYDTWAGDYLETDTLVSADNFMMDDVAKLDSANTDVAFKIRKVANGTKGTKLNIFSKQSDLISKTGAVYDIVVYVSDDQGRLVTNQSPTVTLELDGPGSLSVTSVKTEGGVAVVQYTPPPDLTSDSPIDIAARAEGLASAQFSKVVTDIGPDNPSSSLPDRFELGDNYPNPFNPTTNISYSVSRPVHVRLQVYNILGQLVATLVNRKQNAGKYQVSFDASRFSSGVYIYRLQAGDFIQTKKMTLLK